MKRRARNRTSHTQALNHRLADVASSFPGRPVAVIIHGQCKGEGGPIVEWEPGNPGRLAVETAPGSVCVATENEAITRGLVAKYAPRPAGGRRYNNTSGQSVRVVDSSRVHAAFVLSQHSTKRAALGAAKKNGATIIIHEQETGRTNERWLTATNATIL